MKIGIISDLHGYPAQFQKAAKLFEDCSVILCAGDLLYHGPRNPILEGYDPMKLAKLIKDYDKPMLIAKGNCDAEVDEMVLSLPLISSSVVYETGDTRFLVLHGHAQTDEKLDEIACAYGVKVFVTGHTHVKKLEKRGNTLFINPGSISIPKDGSATVAIYEDGKVCFLDVETGKSVSLPPFV